MVTPCQPTPVSACLLLLWKLDWPPRWLAASGFLRADRQPAMAGSRVSSGHGLAPQQAAVALRRSHTGWQLQLHPCALHSQSWATCAATGSPYRPDTEVWHCGRQLKVTRAAAPAVQAAGDPQGLAPFAPQFTFHPPPEAFPNILRPPCCPAQCPLLPTPAMSSEPQGTAPSTPASCCDHSLPTYPRPAGLLCPSGEPPFSPLQALCPCCCSATFAVFLQLFAWLTRSCFRVEQFLF